MFANQFRDGQLSYVASAHVIVGTGYPEARSAINGNPSLLVMVLVKPPSRTELCSGGTLSRKRRVAEILVTDDGRGQQLTIKQLTEKCFWGES